MMGLLAGGSAGDPPYQYVLGRIKRMGLTAGQARDVIDWFYDLYVGTRNPGLVTRVLESVASDGRTTEAITDALRRASDEILPSVARGEDPDSDQNDSNLDEYYRFARLHRDDPEFKGMYAAFVHGRYQKCGPSRHGLIGEMREKFGSVDMIVESVDEGIRTAFIGSTAHA